jgi:glycosyltransferase involved in cell wall biosynthesis
LYRHQTIDSNIQRRPRHAELGGVSVVFPIHNESFIIEQTLRNYISELGKRIEDIEFIAAEDGSTDDTKPILERLAGELPLRLFMSPQRKGYQQALKDAVAHATKPWLFIVDSDYQFAAIDFWRLEPWRDRCDVILGTKTPRRDPFYRRFLAGGYNMLLRLLFGVPYRDMDTGFRLVRRELVDLLAPQVRFMTFFNAEFVIRAHFQGARITCVPVPHYARKIGTTTIFYISKLLLICWWQLVGMVRLRRELRPWRVSSVTLEGDAS